MRRLGSLAIVSVWAAALSAGGQVTTLMLRRTEPWVMVPFGLAAGMIAGSSWCRNRKRGA
jgi:hypothetical protein